MSRTWLVAASGGAAALLFTATALSQTIPWPQGNRLTAVVSLDSVTAPGGSGVLSFRYKLENRPGSEQSARILIIETRVPVLHLVAPEPAQRWVHVGPQAADSVAFWGSASREQDVKPGFTRTGFTLVTTSGLPGIVHFWVQGRFDVATVTEAQEDSVAEAPRVEDNSFAGLVVGPVPVTDVRSSALLARLSGLDARLCALNWITNAGVCHSLQVRLDQATASLSRNDTQSAKSQLSTFLSELDAQHGPEPGKHVTDNAYWLLKINVEFLLSRL